MHNVHYYIIICCIINYNTGTIDLLLYNHISIETHIQIGIHTLTLKMNSRHVCLFRESSMKYRHLEDIIFNECLKYEKPHVLSFNDGTLPVMMILNIYFFHSYPWNRVVLEWCGTDYGADVRIWLLQSTSQKVAPTVTRLYLIREHHLHGVVTGMEGIKIVSSIEDKLDRLLLSFKDAKVCP